MTTAVSFRELHTSSTFGKWSLWAQLRAYLADGHAAVFVGLVAGSGIKRELYLTILRQLHQNLAHGVVGNVDALTYQPLVDGCALRSEEHTSELQSRQYLVCRLLLEKKKTLP